jgi:hypothetical protein
MKVFLSTKFCLRGGENMFIGDTLPFIRAFLEELDTALKTIEPDAGLTPEQKDWLGFC